MTRFSITEAEVRLVVGIQSTDISDTDMQTIINNAEFEVERLLNTKFVPTRLIERYPAPNSPQFLMLRRTPVTRVVNIIVGGTSGTVVDVAKTTIEPLTGLLTLSPSAERTQFDSDEIKGNLIDYFYGKLEDTTTETTLSSSTGTGSTVLVTVGSATSLSADDYVKFESIRDEEEITKIISVGTGTFTADLSWIHNANGRVIKQQVPEQVKELTRVIAGIMSALNMVGSTYTFATSYSIPEHTVTKGVPYPHFERVLLSLVQKRDFLLQRLRPQAAVF